MDIDKVIQNIREAKKKSSCPPGFKYSKKEGTCVPVKKKGKKGKPNDQHSNNEGPKPNFGHHKLSQRNRLRKNHGHCALFSLGADQVVAEGQNQQRKQVNGHKRQIKGTLQQMVGVFVLRMSLLARGASRANLKVGSV